MVAKQKARILGTVAVVLCCLVGLSVAQTGTGLQLSTAISSGQWPTAAYSNTYPSAWVTGSPASSGFGSAFYESTKNRVYYAAPFSVGFTNGLTGSVPTLIKAWTDPPLNNFMKVDLTAASNNNGFGYAVVVHDVGYSVYDLQSFAAVTSQTISGALQVTDVQLNNPYVMTTYLVSGGGTYAHWYNANSGSSNAALLTSSTRCFIAFYHSGRAMHYWGCTGGFMSNLAANRAVDGPGPSATFYNAGAGNFTSGAIDASIDRLYLGSSIGLGISVDLTTNTATDLFFTFGSGALSNLRSVILDKSGELPALFWGTNDGRVVRINTRDFKTVFSTAATGAKDLLSAAVTDGNGAIWFSRGYTPGATATNNAYTTWSLTKTNCSAYTCATCLGTSNVDREYCGMCTDTGLCTTRSSCGTSWTQSGICPSADSVSLASSGSLSGGTISQFNGAYFDTTVSYTQYQCSYTDGTRTVNTTILPGSAFTSTSVQCASPSWTSAKTVNVLVYYKGSRVWAGNWQFTYYDCGAFSSSCATCSSAASTYSECRWCFGLSACTSSATCTPPSVASASEWTINQCPSAGTFTQAGIPIQPVVTTQITVPVTNFVSGYTYQCKYSPAFATGAATIVSSGGTITAMTCAFSPASPPAFTGTTSVSVSIIRSGTGTVLATSSSTFEAFDCTTIQTCIDCTQRSSACGWCGDSLNQCYFTTGTEPTGCNPSTNCAQINSLNVTKLTVGQASNARIGVTAARLAPTTADTCHWISSSSADTTTPSTYVSTTSVICPTPANFAADSYTLALGTSNKLSTNQVPFVVYDCAARATCGTCVVADTTDQCSWCVDITRPGCGEGLTACTTRITSHTSPACPSLSYANPDVFPSTGASNVSLVGDHKLDSSTVLSAKCAFRIKSFEALSSVSLLNTTAVSCDEVPASPFSGEASVQLVSAGGANYTNGVPINYASCDQFTTCQTCMGSVNSFCIWCGASCNTTCIPSLTHEACPFVDHITPNFSIQTGGDRIEIIGGNFLTTVSKRASSFTCSWDATTNTDASVDSPTQISCLTPLRSTATTLPLTIKYLGLPYVVTSGIEFFSCPASAADSCFTNCAQKEHCGWCMGSKTCSSNYQCESGNGIWMSGSCVTASLDIVNSPVQGEMLLTATLSQALPIDTLDSEVKCQFGTIVVDASVHTTGNLTLTTTVSCMIPAVASPTIVEYSILYRGSKFAQPVDFKYSDCSLNTDCTGCLAADSCGWCSKGNKCTFQAQCAEGWTKVKCPINKVGLGVGLGLGLLFLLALAILAFFLIRRARKRRGLIIDLKEPNYDEIAWGSDTTLAWRIPQNNYKILETGLSRKDFLLQLAIAFNCPATEQDALAKAMVYVASAHGLAADLIQTCIRFEVQTCIHENTLFRNNSVASKMYKFFSRIVGIKYLFNCIARVILELEILGRQNSSPKKASDGSTEVSLLSMTMELDQTKALGDDIDTDTNLLQLQLICQKLINVLIKSSVKNIPSPFRKIFIEIDNSVMGKFAGSNDAVYKGIGGLFFLRFVCPAITAPHVYGLLESPPNQTTQRQLVLISKVIQNIANMQPPGKKEEFMTALNDFIVQAIPKIIKFYDNLRLAVNLPQAGESDEQVLTVPEEVRLNGLAAIANFLHMEKGRLRKWLAGTECPFDDQQKVDLEQLIAECETEYPNPPKKLKGGASDEIDGGKKKKKSK